MKPEFTPFKKIPRHYRDVIITEKIDGTNASMTITEDGEIYAASRNRWITVDDDNYGFAKWVEDNKQDLMSLGVGTHFGEWWGQGIQRGYGLNKKRFSLFNVGRWHKQVVWLHDTVECPSCCHVVPIISIGDNKDETYRIATDWLKANGSRAKLGYQNPEGWIAYHTKSGALSKFTFDGDGHKGKGKRKSTP